MPKRRSAIEDFKKVSPRAWSEIAREGGRQPRRHRNLVRRRGAHRPEEQDHAPLGQARNETIGAARSAHRLDLHLRRDLPQRGQGRRPRPAPVQHRGDEPASGGNRQAVAPGATRSSCSIRPAGTCRTSSSFPPTSRSLPLPPKCPELNPTENIWQFMRDNWLSNRVFKSYDDIVDHCCYAWNKLIDQPWRIMSIGMRDWAHRY